MKALILNGVVQEVSEMEFEVHPSMEWVDVPFGDTVKTDYLYKDGIFTPPEAATPVLSLEQVVAKLVDFCLCNIDKTDLESSCASSTLSSKVQMGGKVESSKLAGNS